MTERPYRAVSLYSGAGGLDLGFRQAGFSIDWAVDSDPHAVATYRANLGDHIIEGQLPDVELPVASRPDVVIGGPPCQGFSVIGKMSPDDPRSRHVFHFLDAVDTLRPRAFVLENVKALGSSPRWAAVREALVARAAAGSVGYSVAAFLLNAVDFGVPQARERFFLVGLRGAPPPDPRPTNLDRAVTVREALAALPSFGSPGNDGACTARVVPAPRPVMRPTAHRGSLLFNGSGRPLALDAPAKTLPASMGGNATPIIDQDELDRGAEPWVVSYHAHLSAGGSPVDVAPPCMRRITVQEAAALQTFPSSHPESAGGPWTWHGPQGAQYRQIGNAVPPALARGVARAVYEALAEVDRRDEPGSAGPEMVAGPAREGARDVVGAT